MGRGARLKTGSGPRLVAAPVLAPSRGRGASSSSSAAADDADAAASASSCCEACIVALLDCGVQAGCSEGRARKAESLWYRLPGSWGSWGPWSGGETGTGGRGGFMVAGLWFADQSE